MGGKLNRGISVIHWCVYQSNPHDRRRAMEPDVSISLSLSLCSTKALAKGEELTPEMKRKASILGWCIEWVRAICSPSTNASRPHVMVLVIL